MLDASIATRVSSPGVKPWSEGKDRVLADFLKNVSAMEMTIVKDDGLYRHLKIRNKVGHQFNWFDIITWPGILTINGDHGTWVFARIEDMFAFFRQGESEPWEPKINEGYWEEKIQAADRHPGAARVFYAEVFKAAVIDSLEGYTEWEEGDEEFRNLLLDQLDYEVFCYDSEHEIRDALNNFKFEDGDVDFEFSDTWEISGRAYTYRYRYCLFSIVWAIHQYDLQRMAVSA